MQSILIPLFLGAIRHLRQQRVANRPRLFHINKSAGADCIFAKGEDLDTTLNYLGNEGYSFIAITAGST